MGEGTEGSGASLQGRTAVVTGAGSGLGRSFVQALFGAGASIACIDRDEAALAETLVAIPADRALAIVADVAVEEDVVNVVERIDAWRPYVDVLVNNAGIACRPQRTHELPTSDWDRVITTNLRSMFLCTRFMLPALFRSNHASIINIGSLFGQIGAYPDFAVTALPYATSKAAVTGFTRQLAAEYARDNIRVNAIAPGWHGPTQLGREYRPTASAGDISRIETYISSSVPMGRRGLVHEVNGLLLFLASDSSSYVTGQTMVCDGGRSIV